MSRTLTSLACWVLLGWAGACPGQAQPLGVHLQVTAPQALAFGHTSEACAPWEGNDNDIYVFSVSCSDFRGTLPPAPRPQHPCHGACQLPQACSSPGDCCPWPPAPPQAGLGWVGARIKQTAALPTGSVNLLPESFPAWDRN